MSLEKWVPVVGYEDRYEISNHKEVRIKERDIVDPFGNVIFHVKQQLVPHYTSYGSKQYVILNNGKRSKKSILINYFSNLLKIVNNILKM